MKSYRKSILLIGATVLLLDVVYEIFQWPLLFYPLYPGILVHFFIEGAHGTTPHPVKGFIAEVAVNILTYVVVYAGAQSMLRRSKGAKRRT